MNKLFDLKLAELFENIGRQKKMVLSTVCENHVTSRMMSVIIMDGCFYFQTDKIFRKYEQIKKNPQVALCMDNIQIEGSCMELGHPLENKEFCEFYRQAFQNSYDKYTAMENERLFKIVPNFIQKWIYEDGEPYIENFDFERQQYLKVIYQYDR